MGINLKEEFAAHIGGLVADDKLVVAVSGGVDSVVLLDLLVNSGRKNLVVAHLDHGLRDSSASDAEFVENLAESYGLEFRGTKITVSKEGSVEANARKVRYGFLTDVLDEFDAKYIVTGHHKNDQAETIMMNLSKGAFIKGMAGMNVICERKKVFRPLLPFTKSELIEYAKENGLKFVVDESNFVSDFDRNFVRNEVFPKLEERFSSAQERIADTACLYRELVDYCDDQVNEWITANAISLEWGNKLMKSDFDELANFMKYFVLTKLIGSQFSQADFQEVLKLIIESSSGSHRAVDDMYVYVSTDHFLITEFSQEALSGLYFGEQIKNIELGKHRSIRTFKDGDRFDGKKLKEYFMTNNVPWYLRLGVPLAIDEEDNIIEVFD